MVSSKLIKKIVAVKKRIKLLKSWGSFRRLKPFSEIFGYDRGPQSVARYYVDTFMKENSSDIKGRVLEIGDNTYTLKYGKDKVKRSDVLHAVAGNPQATIVADLTKPLSIETEVFDCIVMPQTLNFIYDFKSALENTYKLLKPGGVLLVTVSGISQISKYDMERWGHYWQFTTLSAKMLFEEFFLPTNITVNSKGNVLAAVAFLEGLASKELKKTELDFTDPNYQVTITIRAVK